MSEASLYPALLCAAFWVALLRFRATPGAARHAARFVFALGMGALAARLGGLLCTPVGLLLAAPRERLERAAFLEAALPALPPAFALAKLGCLAAGCCPAALVESLAFAGLDLALHARRPDHAQALVLGGIGLIRLAVLPLRPEASHSALLAVVWLLVAALRWPATRAGAGACPPPGSATSSRTAGNSRSGCAAGSWTLATSR